MLGETFLEKGLPQAPFQRLSNQAKPRVSAAEPAATRGASPDLEVLEEGVWGNRFFQEGVPPIRTIAFALDNCGGGR